MFNGRKMDGKEWAWKNEGSTCGVHSYEGHLVWWYLPDGAGGHFGEAARTQSFDDFAENAVFHILAFAMVAPAKAAMHTGGVIFESCDSQ